jgi:hypothetical protein
MLFLLRHWHPKGLNLSFAGRGGRLLEILPTAPSTTGRYRPIGVRNPGMVARRTPGRSKSMSRG